MAWTKIERLTMRGAQRLASIRLKKRRVDCPATLTVRVNITIVERVGGKKDDRFDLMIGSGEHAGKLRLQRNPEGQARATDKAGGTSTGRQLVFYLGHARGLPDLHMDKAESCFAAAVDGGIEIDLPEALVVPSRKQISDATTTEDDGATEPTVDLSTNHFAYAGHKIEVGKRVAALLDPLVTHFGKAVRKSDLIRIVWGEETEDANYYNLIKRANDQINPIGLEVFKLRTNGTAACMLRSTEAA